jgi:hypothetical protein
MMASKRTKAVAAMLDKFRAFWGATPRCALPKSRGANENADDKVDDVWRWSVRPLVDFDIVAPGDAGVAVEQPLSKLLQHV